MKPRQLKIKGLNSFVEEQIIDFSRLTEKGLFGIFGPTGSGKSTILDAITIALYGSIARDTREFMNTNCDSLMVSYEFEILYSGERKVYCAERVLHKDKTGSYKSKHVILIENVIDNGKVVIAEGVNDVKENIEKILGLTSEDFTRSVVLPQGRFSEFLKLTGKDRRNMLERLFGLERFGRKLGDRIRSKRKEMNDSLNIVIGRVKTYEEQGISEENYKNLKEQLTGLEAKKEEIRQEKESLDKEYELNKNIWELQLELAEYENKQKELQRQAPEVEVKKLNLKASQNAWSVKPYLETVRDIEARVNTREAEIGRMKLQLKDSTAALSNKEKEYSYWQEKKERELPLIIQRETNLSRALEILNKLKLIEEERTVLLKEYNEKNKSLSEINKSIELDTEKLSSLQTTRQETEVRLEEIKIDPSYRDDINKLSNLQQEAKKLTASISELKERQQNRNASISAMEKELREIVMLKDEKLREVAVTEERISHILTSPPPDNTLLFEKKDSIFKLEKLLEELEGFKAKKEEINSELLGIDKKTAALNKEYEELQQENKLITERILLVEKDIAEGEKKHLSYLLASELKEDEACPVCGSKHHPELAVEEDSSRLELLKEKETLVHSQKNLEDSIRKIEVEKAMLKKNREYIAAYLEPLEIQYGGLEIELTKRQKEAALKEFEAINSSIEKWNKDKEVLEKKLTEVKEDKTSVQQKEIKLEEKLKAERTAFAETSLDIQNNEKKLQPVIEEVNNLIALYEVDDVEKIQGELKQKEKENQELQTKLKKLNEEMNKLTAEREALIKQKTSLEIDIARILESGKEKRTVIDRETQYAKELSEGREVQQYLEEVILNKNILVDSEVRTRKEYEKTREENTSLNESLLRETTLNNSLILQLSEQKQLLVDQLKRNGFEDENIVETKLLPEEIMKGLEQQISIYNNNLNTVNTNLDRILLKIGQRRIKEEEWQQLIARRSEMNSSFEDNIRKVAEVTHKIKEMDTNLTEYKGLLRHKKELEHICSNIDDIAKLVEGNKFVEFVALNQLKYICIEASRRLKNITGGRYALEIDGSGNFIMRDDFNGGSRRATGTLSGGETFLTSLCLALALSSQVQLKGSAPLEFFFLDEGFGTLDTDLLDTVMNSLEKLYSDRLCVGIISHVEEIKNRVPVKLIVEPAQHGLRGSRVKIELS